MLLTVNAGNTTIGFGVFERGELVRHGSVPADDLQTLPDHVGADPVSAIALASVVPSRTDQLVALLAQAYAQPVLIAGRDLRFDLDIQCDDPAAVGVDRLLNAVAAHARVRGAAVIADVGTAVTVDLVSERGSFCGGAISAGPEAILRALAQRTELLPEVSLAPPSSPLGHNTADAMRAGAWYGVVGMVRELVARIAERRAGPPAVLVTGGAGRFVAEALTPPAEYLPCLALEGLAIMAQTP